MDEIQKFIVVIFNLELYKVYIHIPNYIIFCIDDITLIVK